MAGYTEQTPRRNDHVPTPVQRACALIADARLHLLRQEGEAFQDAAALLESIVPHIEGLDQQAGGR